MTVRCAPQITTPDVLLDPHAPHPGAVLPVNESSLRPPKRTHFLYVNLTQPLLPTGQLRCVSLAHASESMNVASAWTSSKRMSAFTCVSCGPYNCHPR